MTTYAEAVKRLEPVIPNLFDALQAGLDVSTEEHARHGLTRQGDPHYFAHTARRHVCQRLLSAGLLASDPDEERSALRMSGIQLIHNGLVVWVMRGEELPVAATASKQRFYRQERALDGADNLMLLWTDVDGQLTDPMRLIRPTGGDGRRRSLTFEWSGPLSRRMIGMRARDLDELEPEQRWNQMGGDTGA